MMLPYRERVEPDATFGSFTIFLSGSDQALVEFQTEDAIMEAVGDESDAFASDLAEFGAAYGELARDDHRRFVDAFRNGEIPGVDAG